MFQHSTTAEVPGVGSIGHKLICIQRCRRDVPLRAFKQMAHLSQTGQFTFGADL